MPQKKKPAGKKAVAKKAAPAKKKAASPKKIAAPPKKKAAPQKKMTAAVKAPAHKAKPAAATSARGGGLAASTPGITLSTLRENLGARPKRTRVGRGHGSGMVKTAGEGGKGQTVRSGGGKGPAFEGGQTPWARRLPHKRGYSQKARDIGHFRTTFAVVNVSSLADWDPKVEVSPQSLVAKRVIGKAMDGVKILGGVKPGKKIPAGLVFRDVLFSQSARDALTAAGAKLGEE
jgi:large subunit ribosomal protein L15